MPGYEFLQCQKCGAIAWKAQLTGDADVYIESHDYNGNIEIYPFTENEETEILCYWCESCGSTVQRFLDIVREVTKVITEPSNISTTATADRLLAISPNQGDAHASKF